MQMNRPSASKNADLSTVSSPHLLELEVQQEKLPLLKLLTILENIFMTEISFSFNKFS